MLFYKLLLTTTTGEDIFNEVTSYFTKKQIAWKKCSVRVLEKKLLKIKYILKSMRFLT
jgi:hypothetical protein